MLIKQLYRHYQQHPAICTDSRKVEPGVLFFALKGDNFDGNHYALQAIEKGAHLAVVDDPKLKEEEGCFFVPDVLGALQQLAYYHRLQFEIPFIGLTGTNGKTTTKELLKAVLETTYRVHATKGNLNNHIGVPLTLLSMPPDTEIAIIEMGANHPGEIRALCQIAAPTYGCITNVGRAHLEGFGSFEGVKKTKAELYKWLAMHSGTAFINKDEKHLTQMAEMVANKYFYGTNTRDFRISPVKGQVYAGAIINEGRDNEITIQSHLIGDYNYENIKTALAIGHYFEVGNEALKKGIENYHPKNNRSQLVRDKAGNTIIMDAYNANPVSMDKALRNLAAMDFREKKKIAIIGDMLELGDESEEEHRKILFLAKSLPIDQIILVGTEFCRIASDTSCFRDVNGLKEWFSKQNIKDCVILLKGSRGIQLEKIL